jgi:hypothetical protein
MNNNALLGELKLPELRLPEWQTEQQTRQNTTANRTTGSRSTRTRSTTRPAAQGRTEPRSVAATQPALDFRGSDYGGVLPPETPPEEILGEEPPAETTPQTAGLTAEPAEPTAEPEGTEPPGIGPMPASRNTRSNPIFSDEEFRLELPDYNPLLE